MLLLYKDRIEDRCTDQSVLLLDIVVQMLHITLHTDRLQYHQQITIIIINKLTATTAPYINIYFFLLDFTFNLKS